MQILLNEEYVGSHKEHPSSLGVSKYYTDFLSALK